jgi:hypothetical protein
LKEKRQRMLDTKIKFDFFTLSPENHFCSPNFTSIFDQAINQLFIICSLAKRYISHLDHHHGSQIHSHIKPQNISKHLSFRAFSE